MSHAVCFRVFVATAGVHPHANGGCLTQPALRCTAAQLSTAEKAEESYTRIPEGNVVTFVVGYFDSESSSICVGATGAAPATGTLAFAAGIELGELCVLRSRFCNLRQFLPLLVDTERTSLFIFDLVQYPLRFTNVIKSIKVRVFQRCQLNLHFLSISVLELLLNYL